MPCRDDGAELYEERHENRQLRERNDKLAQMLCSLCSFLESNRYTHVFKYISGLSEWWAEHKRIDALRMAKEKAEREKVWLKNKALAKLTQEERQVLGL